MPRLPIKESTKLSLFANSANLCAYPDCRIQLRSKDTTLGQICHIEAAEKGGQRFNPDNSDEDNRHYDNLILLCANHHKVTDDVKEYPVKKLKQMKAQHEERVQAFINGYDATNPFLLETVPFSLNDFVGRGKQLKKLRQILLTDTKATLINGLGGIGKTTLAKAYVHTFKYQYQHIVWVSKTASHIFDNLITATAFTDRLGVTANLDFKDKGYQRNMRHIQQALLNLEGINLLVLDNVEDELLGNAHIELLPNNPQKWHILATSRQPNTLLNPLDLEVLAPKEAHQLFIHHCPKAKTDADLDDLLATLGYHALAIMLLAKTLNSPFCSLNCAQAMHHIQQHKWDEGNLDTRIRSNYSEGNKAAMAHLDAAFEMSPLGELEIWWLKHFTVMPPQPHSIKFLMEITDADKQDNKKAYRDSLQNLVETGWIQIRTNEDEEQLFECHRLLQEVLLQKETLNWEDNTDLLAYIWNLRNLISPSETEHYIDKKEWIPFCSHIYRLVDNLVHEDFANFLNSYTLLLQYVLADYEEAIKVQSKVIEITEELLDDNHPSLATSYNNLGLIYKAQGKLTDAEQWQLKAIAIDEKVLDENHPSLATSYNNLGLICQAQGKLAVAEQWQLKAIAIREKVLDKNHPSLATSYNNLAGIYQDQGKLADAEQWQLKAIEIWEKVLDENHPDLATSYNNLALIYQAQGSLAVAEKWQLKAIAIREKVLGENHPDRAQSYNNLAAIYRHQGKLEEAEQWHLKAIAIEEKVLDENHPSLAISYWSMGALLAKMKELPKALALCEKALVIFQKSLPAGHPHIVNCESWVKHIKKQMGKG